MMDSKLVEEIKNLLKDVEIFLTQTLKSSTLSKDGISKKTQLVNSVHSVIQKLAGDDDEPIQEMYDDVDIQEGETIQDDCDQLYEITDVDPAPDSDNVSKKSQDDKTEDGDDPYGYGGAGAKIESIAAEKITNPTYSGNLEKKSKNLIGKTWQTRYCAIKDNVFYYYKKKTSGEQQGSIVLNGYEGRPCSHLDNPKKKECNFELVCPTKRSFQFIAPDSTVMNTWIESIRKASKIPFPTNTGGIPANSGQQAEDFDALYEDTVLEETYDDTDINPNPEEDGDCDGLYELVESDYADARRKQEEATNAALRSAVSPVTPLPAKPPATPLPPKPSTSEPDDFGDLYDDVDIQPSPRDAPTSKPLPQLPPQPQSPAQSKPLPSVPQIPARSPIADSPNTQPKGSTAPTIPIPSEQTNGDVTPEPWEEDYSNIYMSKWDCEGSDNELALKRGELVHILSREYDSYGWWVGEKNFKVGLIPLDYLMRAYRV